MPVTRISEKDALAAHTAIHGGKTDVTLVSGEKLRVEKNASKCRVVKFSGGVTAAEQNKAKPSQWAEKAKKGAKITWLLTGPAPANWGRIVDGKLEQFGTAIEKSADSAAAASSVMKRPAAAAVEDIGSSGKAEAPVAKKAKVDASKSSADSAAAVPPQKKAKTAKDSADAASASTPSSGSSSVPTSTPALSSSDPLGLSALFRGSGHGATWEGLLRPVLESQADAPQFIGLGRDKRIIPLRELTFQALKPNPPSGWRVISFGQSPYPRIESATGIAHFDATLSTWEDVKFAKIVTMRCIMKAACMHKFGIEKSTSVASLRALLKEKGIVGPEEWFQAMLTQGVLFMNASCTLLPPEDKAERSGAFVEQHRKFWKPTIDAIVKAILQDCIEKDRGVVFAWWGSESLKTKAALKECFASFPKAKVEHIDSPNPAAMGDKFCDMPNTFDNINQALKKLALSPVEWLPTAGWMASLPKESMQNASVADQMGSFLAETKDLHKMYLERLRDGLDISGNELADITGIADAALVSLSEACSKMQLEKAAQASLSQIEKMKCDKLTADEAAAVHLYTTNYLYKMLNEALRSLNREKASQYFCYLRLFLSALEKLPSERKMLYRGVALDLSAQYPQGSEVTWWAVSSCTPNLKVASNFGSGSKSTLFLVNAARSVGIKDLSQFKNEEEFVLAPGTSFKVQKVVKKGNQSEVHLLEVEKPRRVR